MMAPTCMLCGEAISSRRVVPVPPGLSHVECQLRMVMGGIGHHEDHSYWCLNVGDPDGGRSYRQSALEVSELMRDGKLGGDQDDRC